MATQTKQQSRPVQRQTGAPPAQTTAIEKRAVQDLVAPDYLNDLTPQEGFEEVGQGDIKIPRLALAQALSPQLDETEPNHIPGLEKGDFFNTVTGQNFGPSVKFVPLLKFSNRIFFRDKKKGGGIICRSDDMKHGSIERGTYEDGIYGGDCSTCPMARFGTAKNGEGKGTACSEFKNFPVLIVQESGLVDPASLVIASMKSSALDAAKDLIGKARARRLANNQPAPMYAGIYKMVNKPKKYTEGTTLVPIIDNAGWVASGDKQTVKATFDFMHELREQGRLKVEEPTEDESLGGEADGKDFPFGENAK